MLHEFLVVHRQELISRCREKVEERFGPEVDPAVIHHGVPLFLEQLADTLRCEEATSIREGSDSVPAMSSTPIGRAAALHGAALLGLGYSIDQVVHEYGDVCQSITDLAVARSAPISTDEFRSLNRCLDNAIAGAVKSFAAAGRGLAQEQAESQQDRLEIFLAEQVRLVDIAARSYGAIRTGNIGVAGATGTLLAYALDELRALPQRILPEMVQAPAATAVTLS
ncbi:MAG: hypothetical protein ACYC9Z_10950 [Casimicrobiaceae bacterium]